jgi:hypothetical protein
MTAKVFPFAVAHDPKMREARALATSIYNRYEDKFAAVAVDMVEAGRPLIGTKGGRLDDNGVLHPDPYNAADLIELVVEAMGSIQLSLIKETTGLDDQRARDALVRIIDRAITS